MIESALLCDIIPRQLSFKHTIQLWLTYHQQTGGDTNVELIKELKTLREERGKSALDNITERKQVERREGQYVTEMDFLYKTALDFIQLDPKEDIYRFIGRKLKEIVALKKKYNFRFLVDDAHGFGTLGETGAGAGQEQGIQDDIDVYFATFAKSMASIGAFLAADKEIIDYLKYNLRSQMFAKSLPMVYVKGALKRLDMLRTQPELKAKLWENVNALQNGLKEKGFDIGTTTSCVTPVYLNGSIPEAMALVRDLRENYGIFCSIVVYPVIPKGLILLRMIPTATHTMEDIRETLVAFSGIRERLENGTYKRLSAAVAAAMGE